MRSKSVLLATLLIPALSATLVACGGGGGDDGGGDDGPTPTGPHTHYVVDSVTAPMSATDEAIIHIDANHNPVETGGTAVNQLGALIAALKTAGNVDVQTPLTGAVQDGSIILLGDFQADNFTDSAGAGFQVFLGNDPNPAPCTDDTDPTTCGQHLNGDASFGIDPNSPNDAALTGALVSGEFSGGPGKVTIEFSLAAGGTGGAPLLINLEDAHVQLSGISADGIDTIIIGGAIPNSDIQNMLIPTIADQLNSLIETECIADDGSGCSGDNPNALECTGGTSGNKCCSGSAAQIAGFLDADKSCDFTADEIANNGLVKSLLKPDVATKGDGMPDALSFGVGATATGATFTVAGE